MSETGIAEITPVDLKKKLDSGAGTTILDIREPHELEICKLDGVIHIPMGQLAQRVGELDGYKDRELVVYCRSGGRSARCVQFLRQHGFNALNLAGGILRWSEEVDPTVTQY